MKPIKATNAIIHTLIEGDWMPLERIGEYQVIVNKSKHMRPKILIRWTAFAAFLAVISFFQINSAFADKHHINGLFIVLGIAFAIIAAALFITVVKRSN